MKRWKEHTNYEQFENNDKQRRSDWKDTKKDEF